MCCWCGGNALLWVGCCACSWPAGGKVREDCAACSSCSAVAAAGEGSGGTIRFASCGCVACTASMAFCSPPREISCSCRSGMGASMGALLGADPRYTAAAKHRKLNNVQAMCHNMSVHMQSWGDMQYMQRQDLDFSGLKGRLRGGHGRATPHRRSPDLPSGGTLRR